MKIPKFLQKKGKGVMYKIVMKNRIVEEPVTDNFFKVLDMSKMGQRLDEVYATDPNELDPKEVRVLFSDVLRSLDYWKKSNIQAI